MESCTVTNLKRAHPFSSAQFYLELGTRFLRRLLSLMISSRKWIWMKEGKNNCWSGQGYLRLLYLKEVFYSNNYTLFRFRLLASPENFYLWFFSFSLWQDFIFYIKVGKKEKSEILSCFQHLKVNTRALNVLYLIHWLQVCSVPIS